MKAKKQKDIFEMPLFRKYAGLDSYLYQFGSDRGVYTGTLSHPNGLDPNGSTYESGPKRVRIADPNEYGSRLSRVHARPIRTSLGTDPFGSDPV